MTRINDLIALIRGNARLAAFIAIIVALVIVTFVFYSGSHSSAAQQAKVEIQLRNAQNNLKVAQSTYDLTTLQQQNDTLTNELKDLTGGQTTSFPASFPGVELSAYITTGASNHSINVKNLTPKGAVGTQTVGGTKYVEYDTIVQIAPLISGDYYSMDSFLGYLENAPWPFLSLTIKDASFTANGGTFTVVILAKS